MKFNVTVNFSYEVDDRSLQSWYGTTDPAECAKQDEGEPDHDHHVLRDVIDRDYDPGHRHEETT